MLVYFFRLTKLSKPLNVYSELEKMLAMRKLGCSYQKLANEFQVDKLTIRYLCKRFGLAGTMNPTSARTTTKRPESSYHRATQTESINPGKTYAEYIKDEQNRKWKALIQRHTKPSSQ